MPLIIVRSSSSASSQNNARVKEPPTAKTVASARVMNEEQADYCANCRIRFEIVSVKFKFGGVAMVAHCPNCAAVVEWPTAKSEILDDLKKFRATCLERLGRAIGSMDPLGFRFRYFVATLFVTVIIAGLLRHVFHVYGGFSREEIRAGALMVIPVVALAIMFFQRKRHH
jgi:hypothetical protein